GSYEERAATVVAVAVIDECQDFFVTQEFREILLEGHALAVLRIAEAGLLIGNWILSDIGKFLVGEALEHWLRDGLYLWIGAEQNDHAGQLGAILSEVFLVFNFDADAFAFDHAIGARRPGFRVGNDGRDGRRHHAHANELAGPPA